MKTQNNLNATSFIEYNSGMAKLMHGHVMWVHHKQNWGKIVLFCMVFMSRKLLAFAFGMKSPNFESLHDDKHWKEYWFEPNKVSFFVCLYLYIYVYIFIYCYIILSQMKTKII